MESEQDIPLPPKIKYFHKCHNLDLTVPGISVKDIGLDSLGIRPEVVPLTALVKGELPADSIFMDVDTSSEDAIRYSMGLNYFNLGFTNGKEELVESEMVGEGLSLIYYPVVAYIVQRGNQISTVFIDGLAKRVFNEIPGEFSIKTEGKDVVGPNPIE